MLKAIFTRFVVSVALLSASVVPLHFQVLLRSDFLRDLWGISNP